MFQNLIANAIKYGGAGGWIGIKACRQGSDVAVTIADRGVGIAASDQARIFEPFYRAPSVVAAQIHGAGMGLSLVRRIVEAHGGRVSVHSVPGAGAAFTVRLPAATAERVPAADAPRATAPPQGAKATDFP